MMLGLPDGMVIIVLDVASAKDLDTACQFGIGQVVTGVQSFEQNGVVVFPQIPEQTFIFTAVHVVRQQRDIRLPSRPPTVIMHLLADCFQLGCVRPLIFEAVQDDFDSALVQGFDLVINIDDSSIVGRPRNIECDDM